MTYTRSANEFANDLDLMSDYYDDLFAVANLDKGKNSFALSNLANAQDQMVAITEIRQQLGKDAGIIMDILTEYDVRGYSLLLREHEKQLSLMSLLPAFAREIGEPEAHEPEKSLIGLQSKMLRELRHAFLATSAANSFVSREVASDSPMEERN